MMHEMIEKQHTACGGAKRVNGNHNHTVIALDYEHVLPQGHWRLLAQRIALGSIQLPNL